MASKYLDGYPEFERTGPSSFRENVGSTGVLYGADRQRLGHAQIVSKWRTPNSWYSPHMMQIEVTTPDGAVYTGRGAGHGSIWNGKLKASQPKRPATRSNGVKARKRPAAPRKRARKAPRSAAQKRATAKLVARNKARARR